MRKPFFLICVWLAFAVRLPAADSVTLTDGSSFSGEIVKSDDSGIMLHCDGDVYTNLPWSRFSQQSLKDLGQNPKLAGYVEPFIEPTESRHAAPPEIKINPVTRLQLPANPSVIGGFVKSSVGLVMLILLYIANLYAAFEVALVRNRPLFQVLGVSALLPIIGPGIYVYLPVVIDRPAQEAVPAGEGAPAEKIAVKPGGETDIEVEAASAASQPKKPTEQVYARGKFTFNKRFVETKFAGFAGEPKGDALKYIMTLKTTTEGFTVERIAQTGTSDAILETKERGQVTVPYADIQEIKLTPITT